MRPSRWLLFLVALPILLLLLHFHAGPGKGPSQIVSLEPHTKVLKIARMLQEKGLIRCPSLFLLLAFLRGHATRLQAGEYALTPDLSLSEILRRLEKGEVVRYPVTIPEGWTLRQIARHLGSLGLADPERFLRLCHDPKRLRQYQIPSRSLEGYLFPDTYDLGKGSSEEEIIDRMVGRCFAVFGKFTQPRGLSRHQAITLASLIEAETPREEERRLVSSVFQNRLRLRMPLQCDPTIAYVLSERGREPSRLSYRDLLVPSPYNTYRHPGLPPGPICNPGAASLEAALTPAPSSYLYFVSQGQGSHHFSSTWAEHRRAVQRYRYSRGEKEGRMGLRPT